MIKKLSKTILFAAVPLAILAVFLILPSVANAANYYVSTTGSNANTGTSTSQAWATPSYAAQIVVAGDTIYLLDGTWYGEETITFANSGTAGNPIIMKALNSRKAILDAAGAYAGISFRGGVSHIILDGIRFTGYHYGIMSWGMEGVLSDITINDIEIDNGYVGTLLPDVRNLTITNGYFHDITDNILMAGADYFDVWNVVIRNNVIERSTMHVLLQFNIGGPSTFSDSIVEGNILTCQPFRDIRTSGFGFLGIGSVQWVTNFKFRNNIVRNCEAGVDIEWQKGAIYENNTIYNQYSYKISL